MRYFVYIFSIFALIVCFANASSAAHFCKLDVHVIEGDSSDSAQTHMPDSVYRDIKPQLDALPFKGYRFLGIHSQMFEIGNKFVFTLKAGDGSGSTVTVTPHSNAGDKVQLTLDWRSDSGEHLLSTKLKVDDSKPIVVGADGESTSTILSIVASCNK